MQPLRHYRQKILTLIGVFCLWYFFTISTHSLTLSPTHCRNNWAAQSQLQLQPQPKNRSHNTHTLMQEIYVKLRNSLLHNIYV